jgi:hypothetical protein
MSQYIFCRITGQLYYTSNLSWVCDDTLCQLNPPSRALEVTRTKVRGPIEYPKFSHGIDLWRGRRPERGRRRVSQVPLGTFTTQIP